MNSQKEMQDIIKTLNRHYDSSLHLIDQSGYDSLSRSVSRFMTLEKSLLRQLAIFEGWESHQRSVAGTHACAFESYGQMQQENTYLIKYLIRRMGRIENTAACSILSYWVAAMQIENDEIARHLEHSGEGKSRQLHRQS